MCCSRGLQPGQTGLELLSHRTLGPTDGARDRAAASAGAGRRGLTKSSTNQILNLIPHRLRRILYLFPAGLPIMVQQGVWSLGEGEEKWPGALSAAPAGLSGDQEGAWVWWKARQGGRDWETSASGRQGVKSGSAREVPAAATEAAWENIAMKSGM